MKSFTKQLYRAILNIHNPIQNIENKNGGNIKDNGGNRGDNEDDANKCSNTRHNEGDKKC